MAKKAKFDIHVDDDIGIIGISCHKVDYWIALHVNEILKLKLIRQPDLPVYHPEMDSTNNYPLFHFIEPDTQTEFSLISNHNPNGKLFPDQKSLDYFLLIRGILNADARQLMISKIKKIPNVLTAHELNLKKIKNLPEFFSDLELHFIQCAGKRKGNLLENKL